MKNDVVSPSIPGGFGRTPRLCAGVLVVFCGFCLVFALGAGGAMPFPFVGNVMYVPSTLKLSHPSVIVLKGKRLLCLFEDGSLVRTYPIDLGVAPEGPKMIEGDGRTPVGSFRIVSKNFHSPHHRFLGLDYPNRETVTQGWLRGLVSHGEAFSLVSDLDAGRCPDWSTTLGGGIGIHGGRRGRDWTGGCIALANEHIEELFDVLRVGDPVEILP